MPFATVIGPLGILRLPLTVGTLTPASEDHRRKSPIPASSLASSRQQKTLNVENSAQKQFQSADNARSGGEQRSSNSTPQKDRNRKRSSNVTTAAAATIFAQPAAPEAPNVNVAYLNTRSENSGGGVSERTANDAKGTMDGNSGLNQWRSKQQDFGATAALLMRPPVRLPISGNQNFDSPRPQLPNQQQPSQQQQQQRDPRGNGNRPAQVYGIAASPTTVTTSANSNNFALLTSFKGGQDLIGSGNNGKFGLGVVAAAANAIGKAGSPHPPASAHTYALPPADYVGRQPGQQVQTLPRTSSSGTLMAVEAQYEPGQGLEHALSNGPVVERSPRRRAYGGRTQQAMASAGTASGGGSAKLMASTTVVPSPPANLPLDHGSYHASGFMPPPVAVVSAPSISNVGTPVASAPPSATMANGTVSQEQPSSMGETAMTAQCKLSFSVWGGS